MRDEKTNSFEQLEVWQASHKLALEIYKMSSKFPDNERYGLTSQIRRSAVSIPANIAEGFTRLGRNDKIHFYNMAQSSLQETKYYLILTKDLKFDTNNCEPWPLTEQIGKMLNGLITSVRTNYVRK